MKKLYIISLFCLMYSFAVAQSNNVAAIKSYYHSLDKNKLIDEMVAKNNLAYKEARQLSGNPGDSIKKADLKNLLDKSSLIMLELRLKNTIDYSFDKDIYDFLEIYKDKTKIAYVDTNNGEMTVLSFDGGVKDIKYDEEVSSSLIKSWERIGTESPEVLIGDSWIFKDKSDDNHNFIMINSDKIRVYRSNHSYFTGFRSAYFPPFKLENLRPIDASLYLISLFCYCPSFILVLLSDIDLSYSLSMISIKKSNKGDRYNSQQQTVFHTETLRRKR